MNSDKASEDKNKPAEWPYFKFAAFIVAVALVFSRPDALKYSHGPLDVAMGVAVLFFIGWLLLPGRDKSAGDKSADNGIAFRLGKALKGVFRPLKG